MTGISIGSRLLGVLFLFIATFAVADPPNVVLIVTDDQGYGDLGFHGNPILKTPHLDRLAGESAQLQRFYVCPVCAPTRASLMTGRYNYRTGVVDTYRGRAMMHSDETTIAEILSAAGYKTGIFGKWHLGDSYSIRPSDQGFQESLVHRGGGITQPADPPGNLYQDPILYKNGEEIKTEGYCSDVFTDGCIEFIEKNRDAPFFAYLAYNCPHTPLQVPDRYWKPYFDRNLTLDLFPDIGHPIGPGFDPETTAKIYGMVENIDENLGRLFSKLDELGLSENTLAIFLTDNGPQQPRYTAGLRGRKASVYEGGIRVPCFVRLPGEIEPGPRKDFALAHIDALPTILEACGQPLPEGLEADGRSFLPYLRGESNEWPERTLFFQWHRGDEPELFRAFAAMDSKYKLVQANDAFQEAPFLEGHQYELFDIAQDPYEMNDLSKDRPEVVARLKREYEAWFHEVGSERGYFPPRIQLGVREENPVTLTRQDWRGPRSTWDKVGQGFWEVNVANPGTYDITLRYDELPAETTVSLAVDGERLSLEAGKGTASSRFAGLRLSEGPARLDAWLAGDGDSYGVRYVDVERTAP
jgi:arylsulfatase/arylsulfatase A